MMVMVTVALGKTLTISRRSGGSEDRRANPYGDVRSRP